MSLSEKILSDCLPTQRCALYWCIIIGPCIKWYEMIEYCQRCVLCEYIHVVVIAMDVKNDQQPLVLQLYQEVITYIPMTCPASNTPTNDYVFSPRVSSSV